MSRMMNLYHEWHAERAGISVQESIDQMIEDASRYEGGHSGKDYKRHIKKAAESDSLPHDGSDDGKKMYSAIDELLLFRQLSYDDVPVNEDLLATMTDSHVGILDYGCGIGQYGIELCLARKAQGKKVELTLCDFQGTRTDFSLWAARKLGIDAQFLPAPASVIPPCDVAIAMDVLEHIHKPVDALRPIHAALRPGGIVWGWNR